MSEKLPPRPDLSWLKNRAAERLAVLRAHDPAARHADALRVIANEYGFPSWRQLKAEVEARCARAMLSPAAAHEAQVIDAFKRAVNDGDLEKLWQLLETEPAARAAVNQPLFSFHSPALFAVRRRHDLVDLLLAHGADIDRKTSWWAGGFGILDHADPETADFLISRGATVDIFAAAHLGRINRVRELLDADAGLVRTTGGDGARPLHFAASVEIIDLLLDRGAEIDARDVDHLGTAAQWMMPRPGGDAARVRRLIERGAAVDIFMAAALDETEPLRRFLDADPALVAAVVGVGDVPLCPKAPGGHQYVYWMGTGEGVMGIAIAFGSARALALLKSRSSPQLNLLVACATADRPAAEAMVRADPTLLGTIPRDNAQLFRAAWNGNSAAVILMLDLGFDPAGSGTDVGGTALHGAAWQGRAELVRSILAHPAVERRVAELLRIKDPTYQGTPLGWCCHGSEKPSGEGADHPAVARLLLEAGAVAGPDTTGGSVGVRDVIAALGND